MRLVGSVLWLARSFVKKLRFFIATGPNHLSWIKTPVPTSDHSAGNLLRGTTTKPQTNECTSDHVPIGHSSPSFEFRKNPSCKTKHTLHPNPSPNQSSLPSNKHPSLPSNFHSSAEPPQRAPLNLISGVIDTAAQRDADDPTTFCTPRAPRMINANRERWRPHWHSDRLDGGTRRRKTYGNGAHADNRCPVREPNPASERGLLARARQGCIDSERCVWK